MRSRDQRYAMIDNEFETLFFQDLVHSKLGDVNIKVSFFSACHSSFQKLKRISNDDQGMSPSHNVEKWYMSYVREEPPKLSTCTY